ncbi:hypothetical protein CQ018_12410 [Arthrobacter sp. MYb227]|nr:hypothetical protein CQ018_12410 [Arthrobacter sp. MYb227]
MDLTLRVTDEAALKDFAEQRMRTEYEDDPDMLLDELSELRNGHIASLSIALEPEFLTSMIPGIQIIESECSITSENAEETILQVEPEPAAQPRQASDDASASTSNSPLSDMAALGAMVRIHALEQYTEEFEESDPEADDFSPNTLLTGALMWSYETLVDSLFEDISFQRNGGTAIEETLCLSQLPEAFQEHYTSGFTQRFLAITMDLGHSLVSGFSHPSCVAQELVLRLVFNRMELLEDLYTELELPDDWRSMLEDLMFEDTDHEFLYDPSMLGIGSDPKFAHMRVVNLDIADWFTPFADRTVNPYAHDALGTTD